MSSRARTPFSVRGVELFEQRFRPYIVLTPQQRRQLFALFPPHLRKTVGIKAEVRAHVGILPTTTGARTHLSLDKDAPEPRPVERSARDRIAQTPLVGGLHHR